MSVSVGIIIFVFKEYNSRNQAGLDDSCSKRRDISLKDLGILIVVVIILFPLSASIAYSICFLLIFIS